MVVVGLEIEERASRFWVGGQKVVSRFGKCRFHASGDGAIIKQTRREVNVNINQTGNQ